MKAYPMRSARARPTVVLPEPMKPTRKILSGSRSRVTVRDRSRFRRRDRSAKLAGSSRQRSPPPRCFVTASRVLPAVLVPIVFLFLPPSIRADSTHAQALVVTLPGDMTPTRQPVFSWLPEGARRLDEGLAEFPP